MLVLNLSEQLRIAAKYEKKAACFSHVEKLISSRSRTENPSMPYLRHLKLVVHITHSSIELSRVPQQKRHFMNMNKQYFVEKTRPWKAVLQIKLPKLHVPSQ